MTIPTSLPGTTVAALMMLSVGDVVPINEQLAGIVIWKGDFLEQYLLVALCSEPNNVVCTQLFTSDLGIITKAYTVPAGMGNLVIMDAVLMDIEDTYRKLQLGIATAEVKELKANGRKLN